MQRLMRKNALTTRCNANAGGQSNDTTLQNLREEMSNVYVHIMFVGHLLSVAI